MAKEPPKYYKFIQINGVMNDEYRESLVNFVLSRRRHLSKNVEDRLRKSINETVELSGFRRGKSYEAGDGSLVQPVLENFQKANGITASVLYAWQDSNPALAAIVDGYLVDKPELERKPINWNVGFRSFWPAEKMDKIAKEIVAANPVLCWDDVSLMLCLRAGFMPIPEEVRASAPDLFPTETVTQDSSDPEHVHDFRSDALWSSLVNRLAQIPADAPEWDHIDELIVDLKKLAGQKIDSRRTNQVRVAQLIQEIKDQAPEEINYLEFMDLGSWDAKRLTSAQAIPISELLEKFRGQLLNYQDLRSKKAPNITVGRKILQELARMEVELPAAYSELQSCFVARAEPITFEPLPEPEPTSAAPELDATSNIETDGPAVAPELIGLETSLSGPEQQAEEKLTESEPESELETPATPPAVDTPEILSSHGLPPESINEPEELPTSTDPAEKSLLPEATPQDSSIQTLANHVLANESTESWRPFVWSLILNGDIPFAYWTVKSKEEMGGAHEIPSWLLQALCGSFQLENEYQPLVNSLLDLSINDLPAAKEKSSLALLLIAAAIKPAVIAPYSGLSAWLRKLSIGDALDGVITAVMNFSEHGVPLHAEDIAAAVGDSQRGKALQSVVRTASEWLYQAPSRKLKYSRAATVWRHLVKPGGELHTILKTVSENRQLELASVQSQLEPWLKKTSLSEKIDEIDGALVRLKPVPIVGAAREQLENHLFEACEIAHEWCYLVAHENEIASRGNWILAQVSGLRTELAMNLDPALLELDQWTASAKPLEIRAAATCLKSSLGMLAQLMKIEIKCNEDTSRKFISFDRQSPTIAENLKQYLILLPELDLRDNLEPVSLENAINSIATYYTNVPTMSAVFEKHLLKQDYRFADRFEGLIDGDPSALMRDRISSSQGHLRDLRKQVENEIEQGIVDGIVTDAERAAFSDSIEQIDIDGSLNFHRHYMTLNQIRQDIATARTNRLADLTNIWCDLRPTVLDSTSISPENKTRIVDSIEQSIAKSDTRLVEEYIARAKSVLDEFRDWDASVETHEQERDRLDEFIAVHPEITRALDQDRLDGVARQIKDGIYRDSKTISGKTLSSPRREEADEAIRAWRRLKNYKTDRNSMAAKVILSTILSYLGFVFDPKQNDPIQLQIGDDSLLARVAMSDSEQAKPIHHFGSRANGKYQLICLWERPGNETIASRIKQFRLKNDNVIVFYLGRLGLKQRDSLIQLNYDERFNMVVLDEVLLVYLAREQDSRLNAFLRCAVPFSSINPYTPFQAGDVPPEMFYGRRDMIYTLQQQTGSCIVYGGRQLGKSALLKQVEREFNNPGRDQYAKVLDIKMIGDTETQTPTDALWKKLRHAFKELGLFTQEVRTDRPDEIERHIRRLLRDNPQRRILILFDEADNFLDADARQNFKTTERLRILMVETDRKFKVVFAGLHNVQRFQSNPNQPLAHFGTPLLIGPLDARTAVDLIREPLQFLGYHFADISGPLRILTFTNYHPGLIQLFCQELLERIRGNKPNRLPPYEITQNDIEVVYRQVKDKISERFDWTLALDPSYQAIAWSMIYDQISIRDSYSHSYAPSDLLAKVRSLLPKRFNDVTLDNFAGLLQEMKGLGVLARDNSGNYRLRSPNVVRLTTSESEIETKLVELMDKPPKSRSSDSFHSLIEKGIYNPFNFQQERRLNAFESGVSILFAGNMLFNQKNSENCPVIPELIARLLDANESEETNDKFIEIPIYVSSGEDLKMYLDNKIEKDKSRVFVYYPMEASPIEEMISLIEGALEYVATIQKRRSKQTVRFFFGFSPKALRTWLELEGSQRRALENKADVFYPLLWTNDGISHRLELEQMLNREDICKSILEVTGGTYQLINLLFERLSSRRGGIKDDPRDEIERLNQELIGKESHLVAIIMDDLGIDHYPLAHQILRFIFDNGGDAIPSDLISPEYIPFDAEKHSDHYRAALMYLALLNSVSIRAVDGTETIDLNPLIKKVL